jgi:hypothetical protein
MDNIETVSLGSNTNYDIGKAVAVVDCVFKENAEPLDKILERLIKNDA